MVGSPVVYILYWEKSLCKGSPRQRQTDPDIKTKSYYIKPPSNTACVTGLLLLQRQRLMLEQNRLLRHRFVHLFFLKFNYFGTSSQNNSWPFLDPCFCVSLLELWTQQEWIENIKCAMCVVGAQNAKVHSGFDQHRDDLLFPAREVGRWPLPFQIKFDLEIEKIHQK